MLRSLFSGVTGLQAHQIAMDVESNNIANVNTIGFKYSRANFSDLLAQTSQIATAPQGDLGGKNAVQVGLGTSINSVTKIMTQGSIQNTDKNTDVAIQGDGFFIVSSDGGSTYKYTRAGDFKFDAAGNFVDNNGFIVQGWVRDPDTNLVDSTTPISNINIAPGLTTPANETTDVVLKANLDSGLTVETFDATSTMASYKYQDYLSYLSHTAPYSTAETEAYTQHTANINAAEDINVMFNDQGESLIMQQGQGMWVSYKPATLTRYIDATNGPISFDINGTAFSGTLTAGDAEENAQYIASLINTKTSSTGVVAVPTSGGGFVLTNDNSRESDDDSTKNIMITGTLGFTDAAFTTQAVDNPITDTNYKTAYKYTYSNSAVDISSTNKTDTTFRTTEQLRLILENHAQDVVGDGITPIPQQTELDFSSFTLPGGDVNVVIDGTTYTITAPADMAAIVTSLTTQLPTFTFSAVGTVLTAEGLSTGNSFNISASQGANVAGVTPTVVGSTGNADGIEVIINSRGQFEITNSNDGDTNTNEHLQMQITAYKNNILEINKNDRFTTAMQSLNGVITEGSTGLRLSQGLNAATHSASIDIYDSLGSKHTLRMEFRKTSFDKTSGATWEMKLSVPEPGEINTVEPLNEYIGQISFGPDGALSSYSPTNINFTGNNGSTPNQNVQIDLGTSGAFDGITSFDATSSTSGISQDGFPGGDLVGIRIDQSGTLVGSFSNGRSFGLAQIGMAKFTNNEGLVADGSNVYLQSANSGDPIIGTAATAGRGFMQSSALEASNVDLSKSLTQLIIIQRGYQANGKTITTSDTLLETLIGLKR